METKGFFQFEIIINVLVGNFRSISIPMLWVYGYFKYFYSYIAGIDFRHHNLTSVDVRLRRLKSIPALEVLILICYVFRVFVHSEFFITSILLYGFPVNTKHLYTIYTMLDQRLRRWPDFVIQMFCILSFIFSIASVLQSMIYIGLGF